MRLALNVVGYLEQVEPAIATKTGNKINFTVKLVTATQTMNFTDYAKFQLLNNKTDFIDGFAPGDRMRVHFYIKASHKGVPVADTVPDDWFNNLDVYRIEKC